MARFNPPPNWPVPSKNWTPPPGWSPDPSWGPAPEGWPLWVEEGKQKSWVGRHKILTSVGAVIALIVVINLASSGSGDGSEDTAAPATTTTAPSTEAATGAPETPAQPTEENQAAQEAQETQAPQETLAVEEEMPGIGVPVRDGKFEFTVMANDCGATTLGNEYLSTDAQGQFCVVDISVKNIGDEPQSFFGDNQAVFNEAGQKFSSDGSAAIYLDDADSLYSEINPGNEVASKVVFDVPDDVTPTSIELHDSAFSDGVTVSLS